MRKAAQQFVKGMKKARGGERMSEYECYNIHEKIESLRAQLEERDERIQELTRLFQDAQEFLGQTNQKLMRTEQAVIVKESLLSDVENQLALANQEIERLKAELKTTNAFREIELMYKQDAMLRFERAAEHVSQLKNDNAQLRAQLAALKPVWGKWVPNKGQFGLGVKTVKKLVCHSCDRLVMTIETWQPLEEKYGFVIFRMLETDPPRRKIIAESKGAEFNSPAVAQRLAMEAAEDWLKKRPAEEKST